MTKSALAVARTALSVARESLPAYASKFSRHDFTQHQYFAILTVREFLKLDYRGLEQLLMDWSDLRAVLELKTVPDHSNLHRAALRMLEKKGRTPCSKAPYAARGRAA
jgi:hypothetical protein